MTSTISTITEIKKCSDVAPHSPCSIAVCPTSGLSCIPKPDDSGCQCVDNFTPSPTSTSTTSTMTTNCESTLPSNCANSICPISGLKCVVNAAGTACSCIDNDDDTTTTTTTTTTSSLTCNNTPIESCESTLCPSTSQKCVKTQINGAIVCSCIGGSTSSSSTTTTTIMTKCEDVPARLCEQYTCPNDPSLRCEKSTTTLTDGIIIDICRCPSSSSIDTTTTTTMTTTNNVVKCEDLPLSICEQSTCPQSASSLKCKLSTDNTNDVVTCRCQSDQVVVSSAIGIFMISSTATTATIIVTSLILVF